MKFIVGKKDGMTEIYKDDGRCVPVTVVSVPRVVVTALRTEDKDGYSAVQVGYGTKSEKKVTKADKGRIGGAAPFEGYVEFCMNGDEKYEVNQAIELSAFVDGEVVAVTGVSKSKGFQGVVKRHGFHGGPRSHGQKHCERAPGSIGGGLRTRVPKGMRMAGRTGGDTVTVRNLKIVGIDKEEGKLLISGAVPGRKNTRLLVIAK